ncbi:uncharacterized protein LOC122859476 isoform X2 [Aphidius gifuensis]|uniref:uncharacterized protein LOC122859476 isoform X2 n=1 Tax=Aphidius gifuensis TaxID=684658 RepID=UPI001CDD7DEF|nr:uncharacterized protein LOC122859476 isoform X2 [Aphidius gifuensis]
MDCYKEISNEVNAAVFQLTEINSQNNYLLKLADDLEDMLNNAKHLSLNNLENPIKQAALSLKNLELSSSSSSSPSNYTDGHIEPPCICQEWGPDILLDGKWTCKKCKNNCQCDEQDWMNIYSANINENKKSTNIDRNKVRSSVSNCTSNISIRNCDSSLKERGSFDVPLDDTLYREIIRKDKSFNNKNEKVRGEQSFHNSLAEKPSTMRKNLSKSAEVIENVGERKKGIHCPCGCGLYQEGDFIMCSCGCNSFIEIVDDIDNVIINGECCCGGVDAESCRINDDSSD